MTVRARLEEPDTGATRSPARERLADAIDARGREAKRVEEAQAALDRVSQMVTEAETRLMDAQGAAQSARDQHAQRLADAARTNSPLPAIGATRAVIAKELECRDEVESAKQALVLATTALEVAQKTLSQAEGRVVQAADDVIRAVDANALLDRMEQLQNELVGLRLAHRFFRRNSLYKDKDIEKRGEQLCLYEFSSVYGAIEYQAFDLHPKYADWLNARQALLNSADSILPNEPGHQPLPLGPSPDEAQAAEDARGRLWALRMIKGRDAPDTDSVCSWSCG